MKVVELRREFKMGATMLDDPAPGESPTRAIEVLAEVYPHLSNAVARDVGVQGDAYVYEIVQDTVKTKG